MGSPFYRPTNPFISSPSSGGASAFSGSKELSYAGLAAGVEGSPDGGISVEHAANAAATKASAEAIALAKSMSLGHAAIGQAAVGNAAVGNAAVGHAAVGNAAVGHAAVGNAAVGNAAVGHTAVGNAAVGNAAVGSAAVGNAAVGNAAMAHAAIGNAAISQAAIGHAAIAQAVILPPGGEQISPLIQLIMRLPGALGLTNSFFEWLQHLFAPAAHDLFNGLDGVMHLHLDLAAHAATLDHAASLSQMGEHFTVNFTSLPGDAPILHGLSQASSQTGGQLFGSSPGGDHFMQNPANLGAPADVTHAQFEQAVPQTDGALAGPAVSRVDGNMSLSGNQRLFSDNVGGGQFNTVVSNTSTPATSAGGTASSGSSSFSSGQQSTPGQPGSGYGAYRESGSLLSGHPAAGTEDGGLLSGRSVQGSGGSLLSEHPAAGAESGSLLSGAKGNDTLIAADIPTYHPSSGGYFQPADSSSGLPEAHVTPLKAKPLTFADVHKGALNGHSQLAAGKHAVIDHIGHQLKGGTLGSHASGRHTIDGIAHRQLSHHQGSTPELSQKHVLPQQPAAHAGPNVASEVRAAHAPQPSGRALENHIHLAAKPAGRAVPKSLGDALKHQGQMKTAGIGGDQAAQYSVQRGDSLWGIAAKRLGEGQRWHDIYRLNSDVLGNNPNLIFGGTQLKLPGGDLAGAGEVGKYIVKPGDNLWSIAKAQFGDAGKWTEIYKANASVIGSSPHLIVPGEQLSIPGANQAVASATAQAPAALPPTSEVGQTSMSNAGLPSASSPMPSHASLPSAESAAGTANGAYTSPVNLQIQPSAGAASAAVPVQSGRSLVSSHLAPDLSFLGKKTE